MSLNELLLLIYNNFNVTHGLIGIIIFLVAITITIYNYKDTIDGKKSDSIKEDEFVKMLKNTFIRDAEQIIETRNKTTQKEKDKEELFRKANAYYGDLSQPVKIVKMTPYDEDDFNPNRNFKEIFIEINGEVVEVCMEDGFHHCFDPFEKVPKVGEKWYVKLKETEDDTPWLEFIERAEKAPVMSSWGHVQPWGHTLSPAYLYSSSRNIQTVEEVEEKIPPEPEPEQKKEPIKPRPMSEFPNVEGNYWFRCKNWNKFCPGYFKKNNMFKIAGALVDKNRYDIEEWYPLDSPEELDTFV